MVCWGPDYETTLVSNSWHSSWLSPQSGQITDLYHHTLVCRLPFFLWQLCGKWRGTERHFDPWAVFHVCRKEIMPWKKRRGAQDKSWWSCMRKENLDWQVCFKLCVCGCVLWICSCLWRSEGYLQELILLFHHVGSGDRTQIFRLGDKHLYPPTSCWTHRGIFIHTCWSSCPFLIPSLFPVAPTLLM